MSVETIAKNTFECPSCKTTAKVEEASNPPSFCLHCRFPLMLIADKYRLTQVVGEGGFGTVYEAEHVRLTHDPRRVVKILKPELLQEESMRVRFAREVQVTSALSLKNHHIVRVFDDFGEIPNLGLFYVMEYLEGQTLAEVLDQAQGLLPLERCYHFFQQLCTAMHDAHNEGIIHRDLKPENLYIVKHLRDPHHLKVFDFGIAKPLVPEKENTNISNGMLGTPTYMAPEQLTHSIGSHVDIYTMGVILYEMLVGHVPFAASDGTRRTAVELIAAKLMEEPPSVLEVVSNDRGIPSALSQVVAKLLARTPETRYGSVEEVEEAFQKAIAPSEPIQIGSSSREVKQTLPTAGELIIQTPKKLDMRSTLPYSVDLEKLLPPHAALPSSPVPASQAMATSSPREQRHTPNTGDLDIKASLEAHTLDSYEPDSEDFAFKEEALAPTLDAPLSEDDLNRPIFRPIEHTPQSNVFTASEADLMALSSSPSVEPSPTSMQHDPPSGSWKGFVLFLFIFALGASGAYWLWKETQKNKVQKRVKPRRLKPMQLEVIRHHTRNPRAVPLSPQPRPKSSSRAVQKRTRRGHNRRSSRRWRTRYSWTRLVAQCPTDRRYYWIRMNFKKTRTHRKVEVLTPQKKSRFQKYKTHYCVGTSDAKAYVTIRTHYKKMHRECRFRIFAQRSHSVRIDLDKALPKGRPGRKDACIH